MDHDTNNDADQAENNSAELPTAPELETTKAEENSNPDTPEPEETSAEPSSTVTSQVESDTDLASDTSDKVTSDKTGEKPKKARFGWAKAHKKTAIAIAVVIIALAVGAVFLLLRDKKSTPSSTGSNNTNNNTKLPSKEVGDLTFWDEAKTVSPLKLFTDTKFLGGVCDTATSSTGCDLNTAESITTYSQIGTTKDGGKLIALTIDQGLDYNQYLIVDHGNDDLTIIKEASSPNNLDASNGQVATDFLNALTDKVSIDTKTSIPEFNFAKDVEVGGQKMKIQGDYVKGYYMNGGLKGIRGIGFGGGQVDTSKVKKIGEKDGKTFYEVISNEQSTYSVKAFYAAYKNIVGFRYYQNGEIAGATDALPIKWSAGEQNSSKYFSAGAGCGSSTGFVIATNVSSSDLTQVGTSPAGQKVYQLSNNHPLVTELFDKDYAKGSMLEDSSPLKNLSIQQFADKHAYFLVENGLGEYVVFLRDDLIVRGGCAKPVIYLYPTQATTVSVAVGADVTVSDPLYPKGGWRNVLAQPNGQLRYQNKSYDSLFWEGYGEGAYPDITAGTVVTRNDAPGTMRQQLAAQGLAGKEIEDFMTFWEPRLPNTPYVRLSWLTNSQLNKLAPLTVSPKPQTSIRVFLDFEGLTQPVSMRPQKFSAPVRNGFTLVEWGGLARTGLQNL